MGLDIAFNRGKALAAGLVVELTRNGSAEKIAQAALEIPGDPDYLKWLCEVIEIVHVPGTNLRVENTNWVDGNPARHIIVRANKWGQVYAPLTQWLKAHALPWQEF